MPDDVAHARRPIRLVDVELNHLEDVSLPTRMLGGDMLDEPVGGSAEGICNALWGVGWKLWHGVSFLGKGQRGIICLADIIRRLAALPFATGGFS